MYVCLNRCDNSTSTIEFFNTLEELQNHLLTHSCPVLTLSDVSNGEQIENAENDDEADEDCIVFKATDLIVETQRVTLREPVTLQ